MASKAAKDAIGAHVAALFAAEVTAGTLQIISLRNLEDPEPPKTRADLEKTFIFLQYPPHTEETPCIGAPGAPWRERGVAIAHVLVAAGRGDDAADEAFTTLTNSLRNETLGGRVDVVRLFGADSGPRWGGNWWGASTAIEYELEDVGA